MSIKTDATIEDLYHLPDNCKAEIVNGKLMLMSPTGFLPGQDVQAVKFMLICVIMKD